MSSVHRPSQKRLIMRLNGRTEGGGRGDKEREGEVERERERERERSRLAQLVLVLFPEAVSGWEEVPASLLVHLPHIRLLREIHQTHVC